MAETPIWKTYVTLCEDCFRVRALIQTNGVVILEEGSCENTMSADRFLATHEEWVAPEPESKEEANYGPNPPNGPEDKN